MTKPEQKIENNEIRDYLEEIIPNFRGTVSQLVMEGLCKSLAKTASFEIIAKKEVGWAYINLSDEIKAVMKTLRDKIDPEDIGEDGKEEEPHITVKYGIVTSDPEEVREIVKNNKGGAVTMGKTSLFENEDADVLKVSVISPALTSLWESLSKLENTDKYDKYVAHSTLAYLKPGKGEKYKGMKELDGKEFTFDEFFFQDLNDVKTKIKLEQTKLDIKKVAQFDDFDILDSELESEIERDMAKKIRDFNSPVPSNWNNVIGDIEMIPGQFYEIEYAKNAGKDTPPKIMKFLGSRTGVSHELVDYSFGFTDGVGALFIPKDLISSVSRVLETDIPRNVTNPNLGYQKYMIQGIINGEWEYMGDLDDPNHELDIYNSRAEAEFEVSELFRELNFDLDDLRVVPCLFRIQRRSENGSFYFSDDGDINTRLFENPEAAQRAINEYVFDPDNARIVPVEAQEYPSRQSMFSINFQPRTAQFGDFDILDSELESEISRNIQEQINIAEQEQKKQDQYKRDFLDGPGEYMVQWINNNGEWYFWELEPDRPDLTKSYKTKKEAEEQAKIDWDKYGQGGRLNVHFRAVKCKFIISVSDNNLEFKDLLDQNGNPMKFGSLEGVKNAIAHFDKTTETLFRPVIIESPVLSQSDSPVKTAQLYDFDILDSELQANQELESRKANVELFYIQRRLAEGWVDLKTPTKFFTEKAARDYIDLYDIKYPEIFRVVSTKNGVLPNPPLYIIESLRIDGGWLKADSPQSLAKIYDSKIYADVAIGQFKKTHPRGKKVELRVTDISNKHNHLPIIENPDADQDFGIDEAKDLSFNLAFEGH